MSETPDLRIVPEAEEQSIQGAMNAVRAVLLGDSVNLGGAIKDEPTRLLVVDMLNRLDGAIDDALLYLRNVCIECTREENL